jgi:hypothetical protein
MAEEVWGRPEQLVIPLSEGIATLFGEEHISSPILREVAYSMWNQINKFYEDGLVKPRQELASVDQFIEFMKKTGVPEEIRENQERLVKVLSVGIATLFEKADVNSTVLRNVAYSIRSHCGEIAGQPPRENTMKPLPFRAMTPDEAVEELKKHIAPDDPEKKRWQIVERQGDTIYFDLEAPKDEKGNYICGCMLVRGGVLTTRTQLFKICVVCDLAVIKNALERLIKHPVVADQIDGPAIREGADSCSAVMHLIPPGGRLL